MLSFVPQREAHLPTPQRAPRPEARLSRADGYGGRPQGPPEPPSQGPRAARPDDLQEVASAAGPMALRFGKSKRLRKHADFLRSKRVGRRVSTPHFTLVVTPQAAAQPEERQGALESDARASRLGIVAPRAVGGAIERNRSKRLCRECFRTWPGLLPPGIDLVVVVRPGAHELGLAEVRAEWRRVEPLLRKRAEEALARAREPHHLGRG
jgi:ribonuclease P protein component